MKLNTKIIVFASILAATAMVLLLFKPHADTATQEEQNRMGNNAETTLQGNIPPPEKIEIPKWGDTYFGNVSPSSGINRLTGQN